MSIQLEVRLSRHRPFHDLLMTLPNVVVNDGALDFTNTPKDTLRELAEHAETAMRAAHNGTTAMATLLALCAADAEDGSFGATAIESVGWLIAELSELAALCDYLAACSRKQLTEPLVIRPTRRR